MGEATTSEVPPVNTFWRINFSRVNWQFELKNDRYLRKRDSAGKFLPEHNWVWSPQQVINMHEPERWGYVYFSPKKVGEKDDFMVSEDEKLKWKLYRIYRENRADFDHNKTEKTSEKSIILKPVRIGEKELKPVFERHLAGWNISVVSPFSGKVLLIKEDGQFMELPAD